MDRVNWTEVGIGTWRCIDCSREFIKTEYVLDVSEGCWLCNRPVSVGIGDVCYGCFTMQQHLPHFLKSKEGLAFCLKTIKERMGSRD